MNPTAILTLISNLIDQISQLQERVNELEAELAGPPPTANGDEATPRSYARKRPGQEAVNG